MRPSRLIAIVTGGVAALACVRFAAAEMHATEEFQSGATRPVTVALLPSRVSLVKQRLIRKEDQPAEAGQLEGYLTAAVANALQQKGYKVKVISAQAINADADLQELAVESDRRFDELLGNVSRRLRKQVETRRYHAGDTITLLANKLGVDAIGFVRMQLIAAAKGVQALNFGMAGSQTMMSVSLVDKNTTDVEAYVTLPILRRGKTFAGYDEIMSNPNEEMTKLADATLKDLLDADPSARVEASDEDVLSDVESLLDK